VWVTGVCVQQVCMCVCKSVVVALCGVFRVFYLQCSVDNENFASCGKESTCNVGDLG